MARIISSTDDIAIAAAVEMLAAGKLVAIPTETVYGLAADACNGEAVAEIFAAKGRPHFNPLIAHVSSLAMAEEIGMFDALSRALANAFWPGALTLVVPLRPDTPIHPLVTAGQDTIALRMPCGFAGKMVEQLGRPVAAPSANRSGRISPTSAANVADDLGDRIDLIINGGQTEIGLESTIVMAQGDHVRLLRPGGISVEAIGRLGFKVERNQIDTGISAPGMLASHYAPSAHMRLNAGHVEADEALLGFGPERAQGHAACATFLNLSATGDLHEAAANLFAFMHALDASGARMIAVEPIPHHGLGEAINDRLGRAAAPRIGAGARKENT